MDSNLGCLSRIRWHIYILLAYILLALISLMIGGSPIPYLFALIPLLVYFWSLLLPIEDSACRFFVKENIIDTIEHSGQQELKIYNYAGLLRAYLKLGSPGRSDLRSLINLERHSDAVTTLTISSDGRCLISGSKDKTLRIWNLKEMEAPFILTDCQGQINKMRALFILTGHQDPINSVALTPDSRHLVSILSDRTIKVWDINIGSLTGVQGIRSLTRKFQLKSESRIAYDNAHLCLTLIILVLEILVFVSIFLYRSHIWVDPTVNKPQPDITGESFLAFAGLLMASGLMTRYLYTEAASIVNKWLRSRYNPNDVGQIVVTPNNETVIFGASDKTLKVRRLTNQTQPSTLGEHGDRITSVAVIDSSRVISGAYDGKLKGWRLGQSSGEHRSGEHREIFTLDHSSPVTAVAIIPNRDRDLAISGSSDGYLKVWNLREQQEILSFEGHKGVVEAIAITPDGNYFVSASSDRSVKFWHVSTDKEVASKPITSFGAGYPLTCCTVASTVVPNGSKELTIIVGDESGQIHFLRVEGSEFLP